MRMVVMMMRWWDMEVRSLMVMIRRVDVIWGRVTVVSKMVRWSMLPNLWRTLAFLALLWSIFQTSAIVANRDGSIARAVVSSGVLLVTLLLTIFVSLVLLMVVVGR